VNLRRKGRVLRIGHRGAPALAPENTLPSIAAAIEQGVDLVEIDVVQQMGSLRLAHSLEEIRADNPTLADALSFFVAKAEPETGLILDLKSGGIEADVIEQLCRHDLLDRSLAASFRPRPLQLLKRLEPKLTTGLSYPFDRAGIAERPALQPLIRTGLAGLRRTLPARIGRMLAGAGADAALLHYALVSPRLVERCHRRGAAVLAWTIEDEEALRLVLAAGVDGVIANDPGLLED
jgi:glycerophosphoryl diester phosphodiesterase